MRCWQQSMIFLARNELMKNFMQDRAVLSDLSMRFVGGRNVQEAAEKAGALKSQGVASSLFYLGEYVNDPSTISQTVAALKSIAKHLGFAQLDVHISVDPTQIGYLIDAGICRNNAFALAREISRLSDDDAQNSRNFLMLDMEDASVTNATLELYHDLESESLPAAITLQAYLYRTQSDLIKAIKKGGAVRLVKGAFAEGDKIAFTNRNDIDANFINSAKLMLSEEAHDNGFYPIFGTHDDRIIDEIIEIAHSRKWKNDEYEFEMLYGVRTEYQKRIVRDGRRLRLYLPFGTDWWPYAVRRVGESFKNAKFLFRSLMPFQK